MKKYLVIVAFVAAVSAYWIFDLDHYLTLEGIKTAQAQLEILRAGAPVLTGLAFFILYVAVASLSLPGAAVLTLAAGAVFGLVWGVVIVSFASTIGATLAFLAARFIFRDSVRNRFGDRLQAINRGIDREGAFYLFTLRLVPVFPFFLINLLMGLTSIRVPTFYWLSQIGMLAGTLVYVNAGTQLARIDSIGGILSPELMASFAALGVFPLIGKKSIEWLKKRRVYAKWQRPAVFDRNLIVIAAGARPFVPPLPGLDEVGYLTSDNLWDTFAAMDEAPRRLVVLGGGPIGSELSQAFARLGSEVWQIEMAERILIREDEEVSALAELSLARDGVHVLTGHKALRCERDGERKFIVVEHQERERRIEFDALICAVGRVARLTGYGLEDLGIPTERTVVTNEYLETLYPNIYCEQGDISWNSERS